MNLAFNWLKLTSKSLIGPLEISFDQSFYSFGPMDHKMKMKIREIILFTFNTFVLAHDGEKQSIYWLTNRDSFPTQHMRGGLHITGKLHH